MPGIYGDLRNLARNASFEQFNQATLTSTSGAETADLWVIAPGSSSGFVASRASTGQETGTFCLGSTYTHSAISNLYQVAAILNDLKGETISFSARAASATANAFRPWISSDGGTTKTYGNYNTGAGATTYEILKAEGFAVPSGATAVWYGLEFRATCAYFLDAASLTLGSAAETDFMPQFGGSAAWTSTSGATVRVVDATATATSAMNIIRTLVMDLQELGILR